jgi:hypothetical protein
MKKQSQPDQTATRITLKGRELKNGKMSYRWFSEIGPVSEEFDEITDSYAMLAKFLLNPVIFLPRRKRS